MKAYLKMQQEVRAGSAGKVLATLAGNEDGFKRKEHAETSTSGNHTSDTEATQQAAGSYTKQTTK